MPRINKKLKGGNATSMPSEYFGEDSGRYSTESFSNPGSFAYGHYTPQSFGEPLQGDITGPNVGVYPDSTNVLTGGRRKKRSLRKKRSIKKNLKRRSKSIKRRSKSLKKRGSGYGSSSGSSLGSYIKPYKKRGGYRSHKHTENH